MSLTWVAFLTINCHLNFYFYLMEIESSEALTPHLSSLVTYSANTTCGRSKTMFIFFWLRPIMSNTCYTVIQYAHERVLAHTHTPLRNVQPNSIHLFYIQFTLIFSILLLSYSIYVFKKAGELSVKLVSWPTQQMGHNQQSEKPWAMDRALVSVFNRGCQAVTQQLLERKQTGALGSWVD